MIVTLKNKYTAGKAYKSQKSSGGRSGVNRHKTPAKNPRRLTGQKVMLINMSETDRFCAETGKKLPRNGMAVLHNGNYYIDFNAAERAA